MVQQKFIDMMYSLTERVGLVEFYINMSSKLEKKESIFRICDFDDTLFGRSDQLAWEEMLRLNRGEAGNTIITNTLGIENFIAKYYKWKSYPKDILSQLDKKSDLILTAWLTELQHMKVQSAGLWEYNLKVVESGEKKILEALRYIIFELQYIPSEIVVYEDRPQYFIEYRELIEWVLWTKLTIIYVEMDRNDGYKKIEEI